MKTIEPVIFEKREARHWWCHLYFARRVTFLSCADMATPCAFAHSAGSVRDFHPDGAL
jgi:hypothetical protein